MTPFPWQEPAIDTLAKVLGRHQSAVNASDAGVGKTPMACFAAKRLGARLGVVCPKSVIPAWIRTADAIGVKLAFCNNIEQLKTGKHPWLRQRSGHWELNIPDDVIPVFDEAHHFSGSHSANGLICATAPAPTLLVSATITDSPLKMRALNHQLGLVPWNAWLQWCLGMDCLLRPLRFVGNDSTMERARARIFPERGVRIRKQDLVGVFPENQVRIEMAPVKSAKKADAYLEGLAYGGMTEAMQAETDLLPSVFEWVEEDLDSGHSVIIFCSFRASLAKIQERFDCALIYGGQNDREEQRLLFQTGAKRVLAAMVQAGGAALDAHDEVGDAPRSTYILPVVRSDFAKQAIGRAHRANGKSLVRQALVFPDTRYGNRIRTLLEEKVVRLGVFNDGEISGETLWS